LRREGSRRHPSHARFFGGPQNDKFVARRWGLVSAHLELPGRFSGNPAPAATNRPKNPEAKGAIPRGRRPARNQGSLQSAIAVADVATGAAAGTRGASRAAAERELCSMRCTSTPR
jgi:hypothetical protein